MYIKMMEDENGTVPVMDPLSWGISLVGANVVIDFICFNANSQASNDVYRVALFQTGISHIEL